MVSPIFPCPKIDLPPRRCKGSPASSAPILDEHMLGWEYWMIWMMLLKIDKNHRFVSFFLHISFWMFLMNMVFHVFSLILLYSIYWLSFAMHQDSIRICGVIEPRNSMRMPMQNSNLSTPLPSLQWKKIGPGDIVEMVWWFLQLDLPTNQHDKTSAFMVFSYSYHDNYHVIIWQ